MEDIAGAGGGRTELGGGAVKDTASWMLRGGSCAAHSGVFQI